MAALGVTNPNLLDLAKAMDPNGQIAAVIEILNQTSEMLEDMTWIEGNLLTGHRSTIRSGLPVPTWRRLYGGVPTTKSRRVQVTDNCGFLEDYSEVDKALADLNGNSAAFRLSEDKAHIEGISQELQSSIIYANEGTASEEITGLTPRYNDTTAANAENMISGGSAGGQTDNGSIWLVCWSPETVCGIYPKASKAGLQVTDKGQVTVEDASNGSNTGRMEAYRTHYKWDVGFSVRDWRYAVRIYNIDKSLLVKDAATGADLPDLMYQALELIPNLSMGRPAFYMSRGMRSMVRRQLTNLTKNSTLTIENVGGKMVEKFQGVPLRRVDALAADETRVA